MNLRKDLQDSVDKALAVSALFSAVVAADDIGQSAEEYIRNNPEATAIIEKVTEPYLQYKHYIGSVFELEGN